VIFIFELNHCHPSRSVRTRYPRSCSWRDIHDLDHIAADDMADVPAFTGWWRELFGKKALALKQGRLLLAIAQLRRRTRIHPEGGWPIRLPFRYDVKMRRGIPGRTESRS
jgi:hypothetical protein